jgi:hypothetical protein
MDLTKARLIIRDDNAGEANWAIASAVIDEETVGKEGLSPTTLRDLLVCLKRGGLAMSSAMCVLYGRTGRKWPEKPSDYSRDPEEWESFLQENGYLELPSFRRNSRV